MYGLFFGLVIVVHRMGQKENKFVFEFVKIDLKGKWKKPREVSAVFFLLHDWPLALNWSSLDSCSLNAKKKGKSKPEFCTKTLIYYGVLLLLSTALQCVVLYKRPPLCLFSLVILVTILNKRGFWFAIYPLCHRPKTN